MCQGFCFSVIENISEKEPLKKMNHSTAGKIRQFEISDRDKNHASTSSMTTRPVPKRYREYNYFCSHCGDGFFIESARDIHKINWHEVNPFPCYIGDCSVTFKNPEDLESHIKRHLQIYLFNEHFCRRKSLFFKKGSGLEVKRSKQLPKKIRKFLQYQKTLSAPCV